MSDLNIQSPTTADEKLWAAQDEIKRLKAEIGQLKAAAGHLNGAELWLDNNRPWRIMLTRGNLNFAVAEQHSESVIGDGEWADGKAICDIVNAVLKLP